MLGYDCGSGRARAASRNLRRHPSRQHGRGDLGACGHQPGARRQRGRDREQSGGSGKCTGKRIGREQRLPERTNPFDGWGPSLQVSTDGTSMNWANAFHNINFRLSHGTSASVPRTLSDTLTLDWHDSYGCRAGLEYFRGPHAFRTGYALHSSPVPDSRLTPLVPATLEHVVAVGYGWAKQGWGWAVAYQYSFGPLRSVNTSAFAGGDFDGSSLHADSHVLFLNVTRYL